MPIAYARRLSGHDRRPDADRHLGYVLTFVATIPLALALITVAIVPVVDDLRIGTRRWRGK